MKTKMYKSKEKEEGITLLVLVITIIILIILSKITINAVIGEHGLIQSAKNSKNSAENAIDRESGKMNALIDEYANLMEEDSMFGGGNSTGDSETTEPGGGSDDGNEDEPPKSEVGEAIESGDTFSEPTTITDDLENEVRIPGGFHLADDSGSSVEEGIVIEDMYGNQFVWIPVGEYNVSKDISSTGKLTNNLSRRTFTETGSTEVQGDNEISYNYWGEGNSNSVANNQIGTFKTSAEKYKGFYIGRFEQGQNYVCKAGVDPYRNIQRNTAKTQAEAMYSGNSYVTSELMSSYAWDTTLNFICQTNLGPGKGYNLSVTIDKNNGNIGTYAITKTGEYRVNNEEADKFNNIYDFLGNCYEWTTEYSSYEWPGHIYDLPYPYVYRGGSYSDSSSSASMRDRLSDDTGLDTDCSDIGFRIQLYVKN